LETRQVNLACVGILWVIDSQEEDDHAGEHRAKKLAHQKYCIILLMFLQLSLKKTYSAMAEANHCMG
jgi:hypothetical protein